MFRRLECVLVLSLIVQVCCVDHKAKKQSLAERTIDLSDLILKDKLSYSDERYSDEKCFSDVLLFYDAIEQSQEWAVKMYDSWGTVPSGILSGNKYDLGHFDACFVTGRSTQYCLVEVVTSSNNTSSSLMGMKWEILKFTDPIEIIVGTCYPSSCSPYVTSLLYQTFINETTVTVRPSDVKCYTSDSYNGLDFTPMQIFTICLFSVIAVLLLSSTIVELFVDIRKIADNAFLKVWKAFSAYENLPDLCDTQTSKNEVKFACLDGIRAISIVWIVMGHSVFNTWRSAAINSSDRDSWHQSLWSIISWSTFNFVVDTFFVIGGFLATRSIKKQFEHDPRPCTKKFYSIPRMWFHRYIRLAPIVISAVLFFSTIGTQLGKGPFWNKAIEEIELCYDNWWSTILFVQNYASAGKMCMGHLWYLAVDLQMFMVTTILIFVVHWKGLRYLSIVILLILTNLAVNLYWYLNFISLKMTDDEMNKLIYYPTHARMLSWLTGVILAFVYSMHSKVKISSKLLLVGYIFCIAIFVAIAVNLNVNRTTVTSLIPKAIFNSFSRFLWSVAIAFIIYICITNNGGSVNKLLSSPIWKPLSKLSFCIYVLHYVIQLLKMGQNRTTTYVDNISLIAGFWSDFGITITVSILWTLAFEIPFRIIEQINFHESIVLPMTTPKSYVNEGADQES